MEQQDSCDKQTWDEIQQTGDLEAIVGYAFSCYHKRLNGFIRSRLRSRLADLIDVEAEAKDLQQETWRTAARVFVNNLEAGQPAFVWATKEKDLLFIWLCAIATNHIRNATRKRRDHPLNENEEDEEGGLIDKLALSPGHLGSAIEETIMLQQRLAMIAELLEKLAPHHQEMFMLYVFDEKPYDEIALKFETSPETVRSTIWRIRKNFKDRIAEYEKVETFFVRGRSHEQKKRD